MLKKVYIVLLMMVFVFAACRTQQKDIYTIVVDFKNAPVSKLYIQDAYKWEIPLDSASSNIGLFVFQLPKKNYPFSLYSLSYKETNSKSKLLEYKNFIRNPAKLEYYESAFLLDSDTIKISGDFSTSPYSDIIAGEETKAMFATQVMNFGLLDVDDEKRSEQMTDYVSIIQKYPRSKYLLTLIDENKATLKRNELVSLFGAFDKSFRESDAARSMQQYIEAQTSERWLINFTLQDTLQNAKIFNTDAKLNMVVLWASWCGPCRKEVPELKAYYKRFKAKGLEITSVSIDESKTKWLSALHQEKMPWRQLIVPDSLKMVFKEKYEVSSIPDVIFADAQGKVLERVIGYEHGKLNRFDGIINKFLK